MNLVLTNHKTFIEHLWNSLLEATVDVKKPDGKPDKEETQETDEGKFITRTWINQVNGNYKSMITITTFEPKELTVEELQQKLEAAVKEQNFESAISIRDKINELKTEKGR